MADTAKEKKEGKRKPRSRSSVREPVVSHQPSELTRMSVLHLQRASIARVDGRIEPCSFPRERLDHLLMRRQRLVHLLGRDIVQEYTLSKRGRDCSAEFPIPRLENRIGALRQKSLVKQRVVDRQSGSREQPQDPVVVARRYQPPGPRQRRGEGHVDGDGMSVAQRRRRRELECRGPRVSVRDDTVEGDFVQVWGLEEQHDVDATVVDDVGGLPELGTATVCAAEPVRDELLAEAVQELEGGYVRAGRDLDQFGEAVPDLGFRQGPEEGEVEEGVDRGVVGAETVLVLVVVDGDLDGDRGVDQANDRCGDADEVGCSAVGCAGKSSCI